MDVETDEQTETPNTTIVPTPAMYLAADSTHLASSVCGAGAAGPGPPPSGPGAAPFRLLPLLEILHIWPSVMHTAGRMYRHCVIIIALTDYRYVQTLQVYSLL